MKPRVANMRRLTYLTREALLLRKVSQELHTKKPVRFTKHTKGRQRLRERNVAAGNT